MFDEYAIRQFLIDSCYSSREAEQYFRSHLTDIVLLELLLRIARDSEDKGGDAPMAAAHWIGEYPPVLLIPHEDDLFEMFTISLPAKTDGYGYAGSIALALGKTGSLRGRQAILEQLGDGDRFDAWLFRKALSLAD